MADRAILKDGAVVRFVSGDNNKLNEGKKTLVMGTPLGTEISYGGSTYKVVPATSNTVDTSTGSDITKDDTGWVVAGDTNSVSRTITIRDKTVSEIDDEKEALLQKLADDNREIIVALAKELKAITGYLLDQSGLTAGQFSAAVDAADTISLAAYKDRIKGRMS